MPYYHYSDDDISEAFKYRQSPIQLRLSNTLKPHGFWITDDKPGNWKEWCESEGYEINNLRFRHTIKIVPQANLLSITSVQDLNDLFSQFPYLGKEWTGSFKNYKRDPLGKDIDWPAVGDKYDGIMIFPYKRDIGLTLDFMWYYALDCNCGCIWNTNMLQLTEVKDCHEDVK